MGGILNISDAASIGLHAMAVMATQPDHRYSSTKLAETLGAPEQHLRKVLQRLARADLVVSERGPSGGYRLTGDPKRTSLLEIYQAIDGRLPQSDCLFGRPMCPDGTCIFSPLVSTIRTMVSEHLSNTTLAVLAQRIRSKIDETTDHSN